MDKANGIFAPRGTRYLADVYHHDPEAFGRFSESIARFIGTAKFLVWQSAICVGWIVANLPGSPVRFDGDQLQLLTLGLSLQAAYAAPLILLAQNREQSRDSTRTKRDREDYLRLAAAVEYLSIELADVRRRLGQEPGESAEVIAQALVRELGSQFVLRREMDNS